MSELCRIITTYTLDMKACKPAHTTACSNTANQRRVFPMPFPTSGYCTAITFASVSTPAPAFASRVHPPRPGPAHPPCVSALRPCLALPHCVPALLSCPFPFYIFSFLPCLYSLSPVPRLRSYFGALPQLLPPISHTGEIALHPPTSNDSPHFRMRQAM